MIRPFIIYALPRSRTAWLSVFLTYRDWTCHHEQAIFMRAVSDIALLLDSPRTGTAETAAAPGRHLIEHYIPGIRSVVVRRSAQEATRSMVAAGAACGVAYDEALLLRILRYEARILDRMAQDPDVLVVDYDDLDREATCARVFEFCLPYRFDAAHWEALRHQNVQADVAAVVSYYQENRPAVDGFKSHCKRELIRLARQGQVSSRVPERRARAVN